MKEEQEEQKLSLLPTAIYNGAKVYALNKEDENSNTIYNIYYKMFDNNNKLINMYCNFNSIIKDYDDNILAVYLEEIRFAIIVNNKNFNNIISCADFNLALFNNIDNRSYIFDLIQESLFIDYYSKNNDQFSVFAASDTEAFELLVNIRERYKLQYNIIGHDNIA